MPMFKTENFEPGCQQCHTRDILLQYADVLSQGKELFDHRGCVGCHRFEGYDPEPEDVVKNAQTISQKKQERHDDQLEITRSTAEGDRASDNNEARRLYAKADNLRVTVSGIDN